MQDTKQRIEIAKINLRKAENAKTVAETQIKAAEEQLEEIKVKMAEAGVTPETISEEIQKLEYQVREDLSKAEALIPTDF